MTDRSYDAIILKYCNIINDALVQFNISTRTELQKAMGANLMLRSHICMYVGQVGELTKKSPSLTDRYPDIKWKALYRARNIMFHDYEGTSLSVIASIVFNQVRPLREHLLNHLK